MGRKAPKGSLTLYALFMTIIYLHDVRALSLLYQLTPKQSPSVGFE
jgi:hypothetical protein